MKTSRKRELEEANEVEEIKDKLAAREIVECGGGFSLSSFTSLSS
jgi:hypothetical protein